MLVVITFFSPRFELPAPDPVSQARKATINCHNCNETGHKAVNCPKQPGGGRVDIQVGLISRITFQGTKFMYMYVQFFALVISHGNPLH